jgi:hypothetical protein
MRIPTLSLGWLAPAVVVALMRKIVTSQVLEI